MRTAKQKKKNTEYARKLREQRFSQGLCTACGKRPHRPGFKQCEECAQKTRESQMRYLASISMEKYEKRIEREAKSGAMRYYRLKASGICVKCGRRKADRGVRCLECAEKAKRQKKEREYQ